MKKLEKTKIEYIKEFLLTKGFVWQGKIRDPLKMIYRPADLEDFRNHKMVRLLVSVPNNNKQFVQRVIVSDGIFKIENLKLNKMDNFEKFNEEWIALLDSKNIKEENLTNEI